MATRIEPSRWIPATALGGLSLGMGVLAGRSPMLAIGAAVGLAFLLLTIADLTAGLTIFTAVSFLELASVSSGVGLAKVLGIALALSWFASITSRPSRGRLVWATNPGLITLVVGWLAWDCLSLLWAHNIDAGWEQLQRYLLVAILIPITFTAVRTGRDLKAVAGAYVAGATIAAVYGILSAPAITGASTRGAEEQLDRVSGTVGDPNVLASILIVGAILAVALAVADRRNPARRLLLGGCAFLCLAGVILTFSRGGLVALGAALLVAPWLARNKGATIAAGLLVVLCVVVYVTALAPADARERLTKNDGGSGRTDIWKIGWRMVQAHPLDGVGVGNFQSSEIRYEIRPGAAIDRTDLADNPSVAHNSYLELWAESGVVGLLAFLGVIVASLLVAVKATRRFLADERPDLAIIAGAIVISIVSLLASDFFISEQFAKQLWLLVALCPALQAMAFGTERVRAGGRRRRHRRRSFASAC